MSTKEQWDETLRGPMMSTGTGRRIFKYQMPVLEHFEMELPEDSNILRVQDHGGMFWMWAEGDTDLPLETRVFKSFKTGAEMPDIEMSYVGFCAIHVQMELGLYIFEVL
jgi:hypothetical protein